MVIAKTVVKVIMWPSLFLYLLFFPFGQLLSIQVLPSARLHLTDLVAMAFVLLWLFKKLWVQKSAINRSVARRPLAGAILSFLGVAAFGLILGSIGKPPNSVLVGMSYLIRLAIYYLFYIALSDLLTSKDAKVREGKLVDCLIVSGSFIALLGLVGYFFYPDTRALSEYGWDPHYYRLIGTFLDPAFTGIILVLFLTLVLSRKWNGSNGKVVGVILFLAGWVALSLTYSRASYLAMIFALGVVIILKRNWKLFIVTALFTGATYLVLPHPNESAGTNLARTATVVSRWDNYKEALHIGFKNPVFGVGYNLYPLASQGTTLQGWEGKIAHTGSGVHSSFLFVFATMGVAGFIVYAYLWLKILFLGWSRRKTSVGLALFASSVALLTHSLFDNSLFYPWVMGWMGILLALQITERK